MVVACPADKASKKVKGFQYLLYFIKTKILFIMFAVLAYWRLVLPSLARLFANVNINPLQVNVTWAERALITKEYTAGIRLASGKKIKNEEKNE